MSPVSPIESFLKPVKKFSTLAYAGGLVLFASVVIALIWANSGYADAYHHLWEIPFTIQVGNASLSHPFHLWINDGLMAIFFFLIGLELKREFMVGELSSAKKAILPLGAALGGMFVPAIIYMLFNYNSEVTAHGWGIPMATDIAFALALLSLVSKNVPVGVKVFLSALAVADDLGAVLVIAFFYTSTIYWIPLMIGLAMVVLLIIANKLGVRSVWFYVLLGLVVWIGFLLSGVHATIAGVLVAFTLPARTKINEHKFSSDIKSLQDKFEREIPKKGSLLTVEQHEIIAEIKEVSTDATTPLQQLEHVLHPYVAFLIMPLFALSNAGVVLEGNLMDMLNNSVSMGVGLGLVAGKLIGVFGMTWIMVKLKISSLPQGAQWQHIFGVSLLAGVGFTMSLFITGLAFDDALAIDHAKYGILIASLVAGVFGILVLSKSKIKAVN